MAKARKADPLFSAGARLERQAWVRLVKKLEKDFRDDSTVGNAVLGELQKFREKRVKRYNARPGGLGR